MEMIHTWTKQQVTLSFIYGNDSYLDKTASVTRHTHYNIKENNLTFSLIFFLKICLNQLFVCYYKK
jgi:hypothetical protein